MRTDELWAPSVLGFLQAPQHCAFRNGDANPYSLQSVYDVRGPGVVSRPGSRQRHVDDTCRCMVHDARCRPYSGLHTSCEKGMNICPRTVSIRFCSFDRPCPCSLILAFADDACEHGSTPAGRGRISGATRNAKCKPYDAAPRPFLGRSPLFPAREAS
jgi:hypothetical protein